MSILMAIIGIFTGFIAGFFGIGGGGFLVPVLMLLGFNIKEAIGIGVMQMMFSSVFGSYLNYKKGLLKLSRGIFVGFGGALGASLSGFIVKIVPELILIVVFSCTLLFAIFKFFKTPVTASGEERGGAILLLIIGFCIGSVAISIGIGGAMFLTPILVGFLNVDIKKAVSMGLFFVVFSSISGFVSLSFNGFVDYKYGFLLGVFSLIGAYFGTKLSHIIEKSLQKKFLLCLYFVLLFITFSKIFEKYI